MPICRKPGRLPLPEIIICRACPRWLRPPPDPECTDHAGDGSSLNGPVSMARRTASSWARPVDVAAGHAQRAHAAAFMLGIAIPAR
jgi:hypothetical protein